MQRRGTTIALAPLMIVEFVRGIVKSGQPQFLQNQTVIKCMARKNPAILELPKIFVNALLWNLPKTLGNVRPDDYRRLMNLLISSRSFKEFVSRVEDPASNWKRMSELDQIHEFVLNKELRSLEILASKASVTALPVNMARLFGLGGLFPEPAAFESRFSAAVEFLVHWVVQVKNGANPKKNNRGMYVDNQLFWYLGDPDAVIVTQEDFSTEIRRSPQRKRIISYEMFSRL